MSGCGEGKKRIIRKVHRMNVQTQSQPKSIIHVNPLFFLLLLIDVRKKMTSNNNAERLLSIKRSCFCSFHCKTVSFFVRRECGKQNDGKRKKAITEWEKFGANT